MSLPWVRIDTNIYAHDKVLSLINDPSPKRWQALVSYIASIAWSGGQGTDGRIPEYALTTIHADKHTARLLVKHGLWREATAAYLIPNYAERQETALVSEAKKARRHQTALRLNCARHHGSDCHCWKEHSLM